MKVNIRKATVEFPNVFERVEVKPYEVKIATRKMVIRLGQSIDTPIHMIRDAKKIPSTVSASLESASLGVAIIKATSTISAKINAIICFLNLSITPIFYYLYPNFSSNMVK